MSQRVILAGVHLTSTIHIEDEMEELRSLCVACEMEVVDQLTQNAMSINPHTYIRKGKLDEIKTLVETLNVDVVVFNDELTPSQIANIQEIIQTTVYDRTYIILEIFKRRARTKEAVLQVDIASLQYLMPRLIGLRGDLSRQRGGGGNKDHGRGEGETKLELDRRNIADRIVLLKNELSTLTEERSLQRKKRLKNNVPTVSIVGYTNSGKSTTLNALLNYSSHIRKEVLEKDMLFATLETSSRLIRLENNHEFIVVDTVGFVHKLPHQLIEAFKSTLEEIKESHLILHIVDTANPHYVHQIDTTNKVLHEIGIKDIPIIYVFNKIDRIPGDYFIPPQYNPSISISATENIHIDELIHLIEEELFQHEITTSFLIPYTKGDLINLLNQESSIISVNYVEKGTLITTLINPILRNKLQIYEQKI
ncbi:MAG: GTPase HflX [Bacilli bacterium]